MSDFTWRDEEGLFRTEDEAPVTVTDRRWQQVFALLERMGEHADWGQRRLLQGAAMMLRAAAASDPEALRGQLIGIMSGLAAALEVEPAELYPQIPEEANASG